MVDRQGGGLTPMTPAIVPALRLVAVTDPLAADRVLDLHARAFYDHIHYPRHGVALVRDRSGPLHLTVFSRAGHFPGNGIPVLLDVTHLALFGAFLALGYKFPLRQALGMSHRWDHACHAGYPDHLRFGSDLPFAGGKIRLRKRCAQRKCDPEDDDNKKQASFHYQLLFMKTGFPPDPASPKVRGCYGRQSMNYSITGLVWL